MKTEKIIIANLKCSGCENTITTKLGEIAGVESVVVNHDEDSVTVTHNEKSNREDFTKKLHDLGYPKQPKKMDYCCNLKAMLVAW
jgi:copper chaperone